MYIDESSTSDDKEEPLTQLATLRHGHVHTYVLSIMLLEQLEKYLFS